jgi:hypothetical protein
MVGVDSRERIDIVNLTVSVFFLPCWYLSLHTESKLSVKNIEIELRILANCWDCFQYVSRLTQSKHDKCLDWALVEKRYQFSRKNPVFGPDRLMLYLFEQGQLWSQPCEMLSPPSLLYLIYCICQFQLWITRRWRTTLKLQFFWQKYFLLSVKTSWARTRLAIPL